VRRYLRVFPHCFTASLLLHIPHADAAPDFAGLWLTQDHTGVIEIARCGERFCGRIVGMSQTRNDDGSIPLDSKGQPLCGLTILNAAMPTNSGESEARITDPDSGKVYDGLLSVDAQGRLHLRGYVLTPLLGETQIWTRYVGQTGPGCQMG
jgi:uncharacterized protein (DUF2147 family)